MGNRRLFSSSSVKNLFEILMHVRIHSGPSQIFFLLEGKRFGFERSLFLMFLKVDIDGGVIAVRISKKIDEDVKTN